MSFKEIWKDIENFEGRYQVSNTGKIKSLLRNDLISFDRNNKGNYCRISITDCESKSHKFLVHRLVATHFIDNPDNKPMVNHIDNDVSNNHVNNLEWVTHSENMLHAQRQGRLFKSQSKAGTIAGIASTQEAIEKRLDSIGTTYGSMLIRGLSDEKTKNGKMLLEVECLNCHSKLLRTLDYLKIRKPSKCKNCRKTPM